MRDLPILAALICLLPGFSSSVPVNAGTDSAVRLNQPEEREIFSVAIIADRTGGKEADIAILAEAVDEVNRLKPDLVIHIGDMVNGYTYNPEIWKQQMREFKEVIERLDAPFYPIAGNHDTFPGSGRPGDRTNEELYKQYFGPLYYSFDYGNSHFVCLYSDEARTSRPVYSAEQLAWLERDLAGCEKENIFIFSHKPTWEYRGGIWDPIHAMLKNYPIRAVFGGHFHTYQKCDLKDGIQYYILGATGGFLHKPEVGGGIHHITLMTVKGNTCSLALLKVGSVLADDFVLAEDYRKFSQLDPLFNRDTGVRGSVPDPVEGEVDAEVPVRVINPLSDPIQVALQLSAEGGSWSSVPETVALEVAGAESTTPRVRLRSPRIAPEDFVVPEILITYLYGDSHGRTVPVEIRSRVPTKRTVRLTKRPAAIRLDGSNEEPAWQGASVLPLHFWDYSMYDVEADPPPKVRLLFDGEFLYLFADVIDSRQALFPGGPGKVVMSDAIGLCAPDPDGENREFLFQVLDTATQRVYRRLPGQPYWETVSLTENVFLFNTERDERGYRVEARIEAAALFGERELEDGGSRFNLSVYDNDFNPYPFVRRWAAEDPEYWGTLIVEESE